MLRSTLRSLALLPLFLALAHFFGFAFGHLVAPIQAAANPLYVTQVSREPLLERYAAYVSGFARLDFGTLPAQAGATPIITVLLNAIGASLGLFVIAGVLSILAGITLGLLAVRDRPPRVAGWLPSVAALGLATPTFFFAVLGIAFVIMFLIWAPGRVLLLPLEGYGWDRHLVLPVIALMLRPTAQIAQVTANAMVNELSRQYVVTARSIGVAERRIVWRHTLRNAVPAIVATIATALRFSAGELIVIESLFYWPGIGLLAAQTLIPANNSVVPETALFLNPPLLGGVLLLAAALFLLINLCADLIVQFVDPRLRSQPVEA
ncbi:MAG: ABC transporter permease [Oscillochloris sp.]|nr:ABC transporter permease [Oscillochloris sp.]